VDAPVPPDALRERILTAARGERENVVPLRPRWTVAAKAAVAVAACLAIGFAVWSVALSRSLESTREARDRANGALAILSDPSARRIALANGQGELVVADTGAALVAQSIEPAAPGKTYEAWVIQNGRPVRAGTFEGGGATTVVRLTRDVPSGARVAVTVERDGGVDAPQGPVVLQSQPV
jgi:anti-sigma-K factor RskA